MYELTPQKRQRRQLEDYPEMLRLIDIAEICGVSTPTIRKWVQEGRFIHAFNKRYPKRELIKFLNRQQEEM